MDTTERTAIPYDFHKAEAARLRREAKAALLTQVGRLWRRPERPERPARRDYGVGSGLVTGQ